MAHPHPHIVKTRFVDLDNNVYLGLTATLKDMRTKIRITLRQPPSDPSHIQSAMATIALRDGSNKAKSYELSLGQNDITHSSVEGDMKYPFEINNTYSVRIVVELSDKDANESSMYVGEFTYGNKQNESSYDQFIYRDPENLDEFSNDPTKFKLVDHEFFEKDGTIKIDCPIDFKEPLLDTRKPVNLSFVFDEVDDYAGTTNDTFNTEHKKAYIKLPYQNDGHYEFLESDLKGALENDHAYHILVTAYYSDGYTISKTLDDNSHFIVNPVIIVEPMHTDAGDLNTSAALVLYVQKDTIGIPSSKLPVASNVFTLKISQSEVEMYTVQLNTSDGVTTIRTVDEEEIEYLTYTVLNNELTKVGTPIVSPDGTYNFDVQIFATYNTLPGTSTPSLEKPSNVESGIYTHDYTPITQVNLANAWMAATNVVYSGDREVNMADSITTNGYTVAPGIGIVGSFLKTADFGSGVTNGLLKDLDVESTKFKYEISVGQVENWQPVKKIRQRQGGVGKTPQENYIAVITPVALTGPWQLIGTPEQSNDDGEYPNIPYTGTAGTKGHLQPPIYFSISETVLSDVVFSEHQTVKVRVTIVPEEKSTNVGSKACEKSVVVVKKISRYSMTPVTASEPMFTGSGDDGTLLIPINAEGSADTHFVSAQFQSNLDGANADKTQTTDADHQFNLVLINPNKRGVGVNNAITYTVTYKINDPNGGTVKIKSADYTINVRDDPTSANFAVTNYSYNTFNHVVGESSFKFDVSFSNGATTGIDGVKVYFSSTNDDDDASNDIAPLLVKNVPRASSDSQSNLSVMLTDTHAESSYATSGITVKDIEGNDSTTWLNYRSGTISFVPYKTIRVFGSIIDGDEESLIENDAGKAGNPILNIPVIDMPKNALLVGGVVESHTGTQLTWSDDTSDYPTTSVAPSYDLVDNGVNKSDSVNADLADSSKRSYPVDTSNAAPYSFKFDLQTKLASKVDSTVYYSKPVTVEFTSASVDLSGATAVAKRGSNESTLKALLNGYETTDTSDIVTATRVTVFSQPNFAGGSRLLPAGDYNYEALDNLVLNDGIRSILIPTGFSVQVWEHNYMGSSATYTSDVAQTMDNISSLRITVPNNLNVIEYKLVDAADVSDSDPEHPGVKVLSSSTTGPVQAVDSNIHEYGLSQDGYQKSDILQLLARMKAGVDYMETRDGVATAKESQPTYLSLVNDAKVAYACASRPSVDVVGTRNTGSFNNRKVINLKINANGLEREGIQSVIISLLKEADHTVEDAETQGAEIILSFESTNGRLRSYLVEENGATVTTAGSTDNLGAGENHELLNNDVDGFSGTALPLINTFILEMGTLDDNDASKLHLPSGSEWDSGDVTVLAVVSTRIGTDIDYGTVVDAVISP
jgi:hypothetical protein